MEDKVKNLPEMLRQLNYLLEPNTLLRCPCLYENSIFLGEFGICSETNLPCQLSQQVHYEHCPTYKDYLNTYEMS